MTKSVADPRCASGQGAGPKKFQVLSPSTLTPNHGSYKTLTIKAPIHLVPTFKGLLGSLNTKEKSSPAQPSPKSPSCVALVASLSWL